jgi:hypothetical protein
MGVSVGNAAIVSAAIVDAIEIAVAPVSTGGDVGAATDVALHALSKVVTNNVLIISFLEALISPSFEFSFDNYTLFNR